MATYTVTIDEQSTTGKSIINLLKSLNDVVKIESNGIEESLMQVKEGKIHYAKNAKELIKQCSK